MEPDFSNPETHYAWQWAGDFDAQPEKIQQRIVRLALEHPCWEPRPDLTRYQMAMMKLQWIQGQRLIAGYDKKGEPDGSKYVDETLFSVQRVYGKAWADQVQRWFWQYLIDQSNEKAA